LDTPRARFDIGAIDVQRRRGRLEGAVRVEGPQALELRRERRARDLELRLVRERSEIPLLAGQLGVELGQRPLARGVDEERGGVVRELVARRALDRPVAERLAGLEDLLDPDALHPALPQALEVLARVCKTVRMVDAQAVDEPVRNELE